MTRRTIGAALDAAALVLENAGIDDARREARLLLTELLETDAGGLLVRRDEPLDAACAERYGAWIARRARREPAQYITGRVEFHGLVLAVDARALIPRPETEGLVDVALALDPPRGAAVLDAGTGSGCIALALARARPDLVVTAVDRSAEALDLARENAARCGVAERVRFVRAEFAELSAAGRAPFDLVVANPPYVPEPEWRALQVEVRNFEPHVALVPGATGLEAYAALAGASPALLAPRGAIALEVGYNQAERVIGLLRDARLVDVTAAADLAGIPRYVTARAPEAE